MDVKTQEILHNKWDNRKKCGQISLTWRQNDGLSAEFVEKLGNSLENGTSPDKLTAVKKIWDMANNTKLCGIKIKKCRLSRKNFKRLWRTLTKYLKYLADFGELYNFLKFHKENAKNSWFLRCLLVYYKISYSQCLTLLEQSGSGMEFLRKW